MTAACEPAFKPRCWLLTLHSTFVDTAANLQSPKPQDRLAKGEAEGTQYNYEEPVNSAVFAHQLHL